MASCSTSTRWGATTSAACPEALTAYREGDSDAGRAFVRHARGYIMLLMQHIEKENNVLFPMAQMTLSAQQDAELVQRFEQLEEERIGPGRHEAFHELMHQLEQIYLKP
ncbi:MAG: hypothetical protein M5R40_21695 [Anaerolineae bacterium]|nr:hypothetical protein [Anaerolineae bacterium]